MSAESHKNSRPPFDQSLADTYVGKTILVGLTTLDSDGHLLEQSQLHGVIESATPHGIHIALRGVRAGQSWVMPPSLDAIHPADPGTYRLRSTGEVIEDPDLLSTWTITRPPENQQ